MSTSKITYREFEPDISLKDHIKSYWYFTIQTSTPKPFDILPDGYFDLLVIIKGNEIIETKMTGIWSKSISICYTENTEIFGIRFKPLSIGGLIKFDIKNTLNDSHPLSLKDLGLNEQILIDNLNGFPELLVNYLDQQFIKLLQNSKPDRRLEKCFNLIDSSAGNIRVDDISQTIGLSSRQLRRLIKNMIGIGPKDYSKIIRFKKSLRDVKRNKSDYSHYYDQAHFIREIKQYTGITPEKLNMRNNDRFIQYHDF